MVAKFLELGDLAEALKAVSQGTARVIHRKRWPAEERILRTIHWFSTACLENS